MISDFQLVLIGIIAVVIVGVIVYNRWQESRYRKRAEAAFQADVGRGDALFSSDLVERREPSFGTVPLTAEEASALDELTRPIGGVGGSFGRSVGSTPSPIDEAVVLTDLQPKTVPVHGSSADRAPALNAEVDSIAMLLADQPVEADVYAPMIAESAGLARHVLWEGMAGGIWQAVDPTLDLAYRELRVGVQLADRGGPIESTALAAFDDLMVAFAARMGAVAQREELNEAVRRAQVVDQFCAETDIEVAVNVVGRSGVTFAATKLRGLAEAQGLSRLPSGEYALKDDYGRVLFSLRNGHPAEAPGLAGEQPYYTQLTFAVDVPRTPQPSSAFERMYTTALQFADALHGELVDDNKKPLTAQGRKVIADTIHGIVADMQTRSVVPGSSVALRLYS
jgi:FtsZ-interacting cell division protein ZipA